MQLRKLLLINYRNYVYQEILFSEGCNVLVGENAQGKTNILEAIYLSARGNTFRNTREKELIRFGERSGYVRSEIFRNGRKKSVEVKLSMVDPKRIRINEIEVENLKELSDQFEVVVFAPEDLAIIREGPSFRREYVDSIIRGIDDSYMAYLTAYQKLVIRRNMLLKDPSGKFFHQQLRALERQLASLSFSIAKRRRKLTEELTDYAGNAHETISINRENVEIRYVTNTPEEEDSEAFTEEMMQSFVLTRDRDLHYRNTDIGVHKDEWEICINGNPARRFASQGQVRSLVLSLKLAELRILEKHNETKPILLLDDVFSELDDRRRICLMKAIEGYQTVITANRDMKIPGSSVFEVVKGTVQRKEWYGEQSKLQ